MNAVRLILLQAFKSAECNTKLIVPFIPPQFDLSFLINIHRKNMCDGRDLK